MPETTKQLTLNDILARAAFQNNRGKLANLVAFFEEMLFDEDSPFYGKSPTELDERLDSLLTDVRILTRTLAMLVRQGDEELAQSVLQSLTAKDQLLPGECTNPFARVPVTVFMLNPEKTLVLLEWFQRVCSVDYLLKTDWQQSDEQASPTTRAWIQHTTELNSRLHQAYPSLEQLLRIDTFLEGPDEFYFKEGYPLRIAQIQDVAAPLQEYLDDLIKICVCKHQAFGQHTFLTPLRVEFHQFSTPRYNTYYEIRWHSLTGHPFRNMDMMYKHACGQELPGNWRIFSEAFLFVAAGREQQEILDCFPRELQHHLATWQFNLPVAQLHPEQPQLVIGLHHHEFHNHWAQKWPMFVSGNTTHGLSAIAFPTANSEGLSVHEEAVKEYGQAYREWKREPDNGRPYYVFTT